MREGVTVKAPKAVGPYSQAIVSGGHVYCSGQLPLDLDGNVVAGGIKKQTKRVIENIIAILDGIDSVLDNVVKVNVYLADMNDFQEFNAVYSNYFRFDPKPARSTVEVSRLPKNVKIEIDCIAEV
jgi:2-iminobutanoate/2-iminopropanoate deaminase